MKSKTYRKLVVIILSFGILILSASIGAAETTRIAIFPFQIHSGEDLDYMQAGLYEMLANRLGSTDGTIKAIPREEIAQKISAAPSSALKDKFHISRTLQADYFVSGSLTALGASISTDVQFYHTEQSAPLVKLSRTGLQGDVIAHIDEFAAQVNQIVFNKSIVAHPPAEDTQIGKKPSATIGGLAEVAPDRTEFGRWQSETYKTHFKGVSVGDVNGDGTNEIVSVDQYRIYVSQFSDNRFEDITRIELGRHADVLAIDVADINANGKSEIFVTNFAKLNGWPVSLIYEYTGGHYAILAKDTKWFYRVQKDMDGHSFLTAQKKLINLSNSERVQVLSFEDGRYVSADAIKVPKALNIYDMAFTHDQQTAGKLFVGYDRNNEITAWSNEGDILWESGESAGGSLNYIEYSDRQAVDKVRHYLSKRILLADTDGNGKQEFIAIKNINSSPAWMTKARRYKRGYITCLEWDASGVLQTKWKTDEERGYISDIAIGDATNDGKVDLVFTVVSDVKRKLEKSSSYLVIQQLP